MNISPEGSPISTPSSGSPPPEEISETYHQTSSTTSNLLNLVTASLSPSSKRRMPDAARMLREPKSRRTRDDPRRGGMSGTHITWDSKDGGLAKREKDEMVDHHMVEALRKEIGDPFKDIA